MNNQCEEILAIYGIVFANSKHALIHVVSELWTWCVELKKLELTNLDVVKAMSVLTNKIVGTSSFGPARSMDYSRTLATYMISAFNAFNPVKEITQAWTESNRREWIKGIAAIIPSIGLSSDDNFTDSAQFWRFIFTHGRPGFLALVYAQIAQSDRTSVLSINSSYRIVYPGPLTQIDTLPTASEILDTVIEHRKVRTGPFPFRNLARAIDILVSGAMMRNQT